MKYSLNEISGGEHGRLVKEGMERAKARGMLIGRPRKLNIGQKAALIEAVASGLSVRDAAKFAGISKSSVRRYLVGGD